MDSDSDSRTAHTPFDVNINIPPQFQHQRQQCHSEDEPNRGLKRDRLETTTTSTTDTGEIKELTPVPGTDGEIKELTPVTGSEGEIKELTPVPGTEGKITRKRGRPAGSKNKPKPPIIATLDSTNALQSHVMEIANGCDIMESVSTFARRKQRGVCILSGKGSVSNVILRRFGSPGTVGTLCGRFEILSLSGSFLSPSAPEDASGLTIYVVSGQGQVYGGTVVRPLSASGPVFLTAISFVNAAYERLPLEEEEHAGATA